MSNTVSVDDEWRMFMCSQSSGGVNGLSFHDPVPSPAPTMSSLLRAEKATNAAQLSSAKPPGLKKKLVVNPKDAAAAKKPVDVDDELDGIVSSLVGLNISKDANDEKMKAKQNGGIMLKVAQDECGSGSDSDNDNETKSDDATEKDEVSVLDSVDNEDMPLCEDLYISTKTKVLFLNREIDLQSLFWGIHVEEYWKPVECVVKKQMKIVSKTPEEYAELVERLKSVNYYTEHIIKQINNPSARRIKFKDERKITVGVSKKDIMNCRSKVKNAFYNCFAIILRFKYLGIFREIHVKVFNTGKLEIPGVLNHEIFDIVSRKILEVLQPHVSTPLCFVEDKNDDNVLINSNFNCGFYIDRDALFAILRSEKYGLDASYDPCIYPGIKCKFYFNNELGYDMEKQTGSLLPEDRNAKPDAIDKKKYCEVSFMIFRTGSCLIVGNCSENTLKFIFGFIKHILTTEYANICVANSDVAVKDKKQKLRKKNVNISSNYYSTLISMNV